MIRILLADDHDLFLEGLSELIRKVPDLELVGQARDGLQAMEQTAMMMPDVILMDMTMPRLNGIQATRQIHEKFPDVRVLVLSMHDNQEFIVESLRAGARGYILKDCASEELCRAIRCVVVGQYYLSPELLPVLIEDYLRLLQSRKAEAESPLSSREQEILKLLVEGLSSKQIASQLSISKNTVDTHRRRILDKVGCNNLAELTRYALRDGILSPV